MISSPALRPTSAQLNTLSEFERRSFRISDFVNTNPLAKAASQAFLRTIGAGWVYYCSRNLTHILGLDNLRNFEPTRGVILAANHRSFFDNYSISCWLFRTTDLLKRIYFPVRSEFFYERPLGVFVSLIMSGLSMYPPIFRDSSKREFNSYTVERLIQLLGQPGTVVGVHPEGTRNKDGDPYTLLKAQPGIGKLIMEARPEVIPVFINGLTNDLAAQVRGNFDGTGQPIVIVLGKPLDLGDFYSKQNRLRTHKEISDFVLEEIGKLGEIEREYREQLRKNPVKGPVFR